MVFDMRVGVLLQDQEQKYYSNPSVRTTWFN
jgi:hypothetical protein